MSASGSTPGGLPYPTMNDRLADTDAYIREFAQAVAARLANPGFVLEQRTVNTGSDGRGWLQFTALSRLDGMVAQPLIGSGSKQTIYATVYQLSGNSGLLQLRYAAVDAYSAAYYPWVGAMNVSVFAWGAPA